MSASFSQIGFGTYRIDQKEDVLCALDAALANNYRLIDTAEVYRNEGFIGEALNSLLPKHGLCRQDIFITTKIGPSSMGSEKARNCVKKSLNDLRVDYVDLLLIHWPGIPDSGKKYSANNKELRKETWHVMQDCVKSGLAKHIGVSNFTIPHLEELLSFTEIPVFLNQCEFHPYYRDAELLQFCRKHDIIFQAYSSLGKTGNLTLREHPTVQKIAQKHGKSPSSVLLNWALQHQNVAIIPKSVNPDRIIENFLSGSYTLHPDEYLDLDALIQEGTKFCWDPTPIK